MTNGECETNTVCHVGAISDERCFRLLEFYAHAGIFIVSMLKPDDSPPVSIESPVDRSPQIAGLVVPVALKHDPYAAFRSRGYTLFTIGNLLSVIGRQMLAVAVD